MRCCFLCPDSENKIANEKSKPFHDKIESICQRRGFDATRPSYHKSSWCSAHGRRRFSATCGTKDIQRKTNKALQEVSVSSILVSEVLPEPRRGFDTTRTSHPKVPYRIIVLQAITFSKDAKLSKPRIKAMMTLATKKSQPSPCIRVGEV